MRRWPIGGQAGLRSLEKWAAVGRQTSKLVFNTRLARRLALPIAPPPLDKYRQPLIKRRGHTTDSHLTATLPTSYPPHFPQAWPSSGPHDRPCFVLPKCSHVELCLTSDETFSQCVSGFPSDDSDPGLVALCRALNSHGGNGDGSAQSPRLASRSATSNPPASRAPCISHCYSAFVTRPSTSRNQKSPCFVHCSPYRRINVKSTILPPIGVSKCSPPNSTPCEIS